MTMQKKNLISLACLALFFLLLALTYVFESRTLATLTIPVGFIAFAIPFVFYFLKGVLQFGADTSKQLYGRDNGMDGVVKTLDGKTGQQADASDEKQSTRRNDPPTL
ncbi:MAG: hypothetical protein AAGL23_12695 [Pseudomonadota bacterium]